MQASMSVNAAASRPALAGLCFLTALALDEEHRWKTADTGSSRHFPGTPCALRRQRSRLAFVGGRLTSPGMRMVRSNRSFDTATQRHFAGQLQR
jgi:hypothetical protein